MWKLLTLVLFISSSFAVDNAASIGPQVVMNSQGNAVVIWSAFDETSFVVRQACLVQGGSWVPVTFPSGIDQAYFPRVALNDDDMVISIWQQYGSTTDNTRATVAPFAQNSDTLFEFSGSGTLSPSVCIDDQGNGGAIWQASSSTNLYTVMAVQYLASRGWTAPLQLIPPTSFFTTPDIASCPSSGDVIAVWQGKDANGSVVIQAVQFPFGTAWNPPPTIKTLSQTGANATNPQVVYSRTEEGIVVWQKPDYVLNQIVIETSSFVEGSWSQAPTPLLLDGANLSLPQIAMNDSGQAIIVCEASPDENSSYIVAATRSGSSATWSAFLKISGDSTLATVPQVTMNNSGQAVVVWEDGVEGNRSIQAATLATLNGEWQLSPAPLSTGDPDSQVPYVWMDNTGYAVACWLSFGNAQETRASRLSAINATWTPSEEIPGTSQTTVTVESAVSGSSLPESEYRNESIRTMHRTLHRK